MMKQLSILTAILLLTSCASLTQQDNTPKPAALAPLKTEKNLKTTWTTNAGNGSSQDYLRLQPALKNNVLYTADYNGKVTAIDNQSGQHLWQVDVKQTVTSGVTAADDSLYVGTNQGTVLALAAKNGALRWQSAVPSAVLTNISVSDGVVIVATADGKLTALSAEAGKPLWRYDGSVSPALSLRGASAPVIVDNIVIAGFANGNVMGFSLHDGRELWSYTLATAKGWSDVERLVDINSNLIVDGNTVYAISYQGNVAALSVATGQPLWQRSMSSYSGLVLAGHMLVLTDAEGNVWALDSGTGETVWKQADLLHRNLSAPAVMGQYVVVGDYEGYVHLLSLEDGHLVGRSEIDNKGIVATPLIAGDKAYIAGRSGKIAAVTV